MNQLHRQAIQAARRSAARRRAEASSAVGDGPLACAEPLRTGVARVLLFDDETGRYAITEQWWNEDLEEYEDAAAPLGLVGKPARDYATCAFGTPGQLVRFWQQRRQGGAVETLIDVSGSWLGVERTSSFCVHYSGLDETTDAFHTLSGCKFSHVEIDVEGRQCTHDEPRRHPASTAMGGGGWGSLSLSANLLWSWAGGDWRALIYRWLDAEGNWSTSEQALRDFLIECRVTGEGCLEFRVRNERRMLVEMVDAILVGRIRIVSHAPPPGTLEFGNCCCHFQDEE
jgi:hypothetical protein